MWSRVRHHSPQVKESMEKEIGESIAKANALAGEIEKTDVKALVGTDAAASSEEVRKQIMDKSAPAFKEFLVSGNKAHWLCLRFVKRPPRARTSDPPLSLSVRNMLSGSSSSGCL